MNSVVFRKILYQTIRIQNIEEHNRERIHLFSRRFSVKIYVSKILKKIIENMLICFPRDFLSNNTYKNFDEDNRESTLLFSERFSIKEYIHKILEEDN